MRIAVTLACAALLTACTSATGGAPAASALASGGGATASPPPTCPPPSSGPATKATITLARGGTIVFALLADKAPLTVKNFADKSRACFYDGLTFHRVEPGFVIQGGDPLGNGTGGKSTLPTEPSDQPFLKGAVGVARGGDPKISNDAQFFICIGACTFLNGQYTNFGQVTAGQDVADGVKKDDRIKSIRIE